jgi:hypothetical protein
MNKHLILLILLISFGRTQAEEYITLFDNFPNNDYNISSGEMLMGGPTGSFIVREYKAMAFTPIQGGLELYQVQLQLSMASTNKANVWLLADSGGFPGSTLESWSVTTMPSFNQLNPPITLTSVSKPVLQAGQRYWLGVNAVQSTSQTLFYWNNSNTYSGTAAYNHFRDGVLQVWSAKTYSCAFRIVGKNSGCARPLADLDGNCKVDFADFAIMASEWLLCGRLNPADC